MGICCMSLPLALPSVRAQLQQVSKWKFIKAVQCSNWWLVNIWMPCFCIFGAATTRPTLFHIHCGRTSSGKKCPCWTIPPVQANHMSLSLERPQYLFKKLQWYMVRICRVGLVCRTTAFLHCHCCVRLNLPSRTFISSSLFNWVSNSSSLERKPHRRICFSSECKLQCHVFH